MSARRTARDQNAAASATVEVRAANLRRRLLLLGVLAGALMVAGRTAQLTLGEGEQWRARANDQHADGLTLPAPRGTIYDRNGVPLAASREVYRVAIAPREVTDRARVIAALRDAAQLTDAAARQAVATTRRWVVLPGRFDAGVREALDGLPGVHFESVQQRFYPHGNVALELLGHVNAEGTALGGTELELDDVLRGVGGRATVRRDARGRAIPGAMVRGIEPQAGSDVYLTIDAELQAIADEALRVAIDSTHAQGGEFLLLDPGTGEVLAAASRGAGGAARNWRAVTVPYEPGSTLKPFLVASLLASGRAVMTDSVYAEHGSWTYAGRTITDVHGYEWLTVAGALEKSSNVALAKLAMRLDPGTQYQYLRDFGFGSPTAVRYPSESGGLLRTPQRWSRQSQQSLAIGYEVSVTPLQMALAYGALANGGELLEPRLVREVRSRDGRMQQKFERRVVRRVIPETVADEIRAALVSVVAGGTGQRAALGPFAVAGKTGTARIAVNGRYQAGAYTASFFPADDPQLVFLAKLDRPEGAYYGGLTAAPITRSALEAALASHHTPLDKRAVASGASALPAPEAVVPPAPRGDVARISAVRGPYVLTLTGTERAAAAAASAPVTPVPDVRGLPLRDAVRALHAAGFRIQVEGSGTVRGTWPGAAEAAMQGALVRVHAGAAQ
jgi:cell division protein FtsI (penicillin-binding protein 3)